jgi:cytochrome c553
MTGARKPLLAALALVALGVAAVAAVRGPSPGKAAAEVEAEAEAGAEAGAVTTCSSCTARHQTRLRLVAEPQTASPP